jgi:hypothetical protein
MNRRVAVVLLTWQRIPNLKHTLKALAEQTYSDFDVYISNANQPRKAGVEKYVNFYKDKLNITVSHDGNEMFAFRRMSIGNNLAKDGTQIILFIDDDVTFNKNYIENCLSHYEEKSYKSGFTFVFNNGGENYYSHRTRISDVNTKVNYCGTGVSMIDASIFLENGLLNPPEHLFPGALKIEDLWLSYYADHIMGWKLQWMPIPGTVIGGADSVALYKKVLDDPYTKAHFLTDLIKEGWKI